MDRVLKLEVMMIYTAQALLPLMPMMIYMDHNLSIFN